MAKTKKVIDGVLQITETPSVETKIETFSVEELVGKKAEVQTKIDHMQIDLDALVSERDDIQSSIDLLT